MIVLELGHGDVVVIVELFIPHLLEHEIALLHISITVNQLFKLLVKHLQPVHVDEVLDILETRPETVQVRA